MSLYRDAKRHAFKEDCLAYAKDIRLAYSDVDTLTDEEIFLFYDKYASKVRMYEFEEYRVMYKINEMGLSKIIGGDLADAMTTFDEFLEDKKMSDIGIIGIYHDSKYDLKNYSLQRYVIIVITTKP